jgi:hypothetical protein
MSMNDGSGQIEQLIADLNGLAPQTLWFRLRPHLLSCDQGFPYQALGMALIAQERLAPLWVAELEAFAQDHSLVTDDCVLHLHLMVMLAACRDTRAFAPLLSLCSLSESESEEILGDFSTSVMARALAAVSGGSVQPLLDLADRQDVSVWLRGAALHALTVRAQEGESDRTETVRTLLAWAEAEVARLDTGLADDAEVLNSVVIDLCELCCVEAEPAIRRWYEAGLISDDLRGDLSAIGSLLRRDFDEVCRDARERGLLYITDAATELQDWAMFHSTDSDPGAWYFDEPQTFVREAPKVGRNDPCPCGSGKKFKKCCGA